MRAINSSYDPDFIYGTAWKQEATADLVKNAISAGFVAIDTANQKKHYREDYVGQALLELFDQGVQRESLFLQSKFTYIQGQDHRLPYNANDPLSIQVQSSFASSLKNLHTDYLDSYLLHGPSRNDILGDSDWEVWNTLEKLYESGQARRIGMSNIGIRQLKEITQRAKVKPMIVQNRCFATRGWDRAVREFCQTNAISYQGFSLLTANLQVVEHPDLEKIAIRLGATPEQVIFRFAKQIGIVPITGTTDKRHMIEDLACVSLELSAEDMEIIHKISV